MLLFFTLASLGWGCGSGAASPTDAAIGETASATDAAPRAPRPGDPCVSGRDCDDGIFCDGVEECLGGFCTSARNAACRDPGGCALATCDERGGACSFDPTAGSCAAGVCRVDVGCVAVEGCTRDADCDDHRSCTDDLCDPATRACRHVPVDARCPSSGACGVGVCLGEEVADAIGCGVRPDAARCAKNEGCDGSACVALPARCTGDRDCSDGTLCDGAERCVDGACTHGERTTCLARDACHHARCKSRTLGGGYCKEVRICP